MYIFRKGKAEIIEKAELTIVSEHFAMIFNAAIAEKILRTEHS